LFTERLGGLKKTIYKTYIATHGSYYAKKRNPYKLFPSDE
jgi:hypothetical protein